MNTPPQPSIKTLLLACLCSTILAIIIFVIAVLPAEFNIDPTGLGTKLGLTVLAQTANSTDRPVVVDCPKPEMHKGQQKTENKLNDNLADSEQWQDSVIITVPAKKGLEYKFKINKGEQLEFVWNTDGAALYFDFHGEPQGDKTGYFKSFKETTDNKSSGSLTAPFSGSHGWYWENKSNQPVSITLNTRGNYQIIGLL